MNYYAYKTNIAVYNTNSGKTKRNLHQFRSKQLHENHDAEQDRDRSNKKWDASAGDNAVEIIINKFKGTLVTGDIQNEYEMGDIFEIAS